MRRPGEKGNAVIDQHVALGPVRSGRHVTIRPILPADYGWVYETAILTDAGARWRLHGQAPPFDVFLSSILFQGAAATFMICRRETEERIGVAQVWNHNPAARNAHITAFTHPAFRLKGWPMEGFVLFADYAFWAFDLHKLYLESMAGEADQYRSLVGTYLRQEGNLRDHRIIGREWHDCHLFALYRAECDALTERLLPAESLYHTPSATPAP